MLIRKVLLLIIISTLFISAQSSGRRGSISFNGLYTTTAKIFLNPNSSDILLRNESFPLEHIYNGQIDIRYKIIDELSAGISSEYMKKTGIGNNLTVFSGSRTITVPVEDGFFMIPVELTAYYLLPFSSENFSFFIGGGAGYYYGSHIRKFAGAEFENVNRKFAYGIHVLLSMDYFFFKSFSLRGEMKFRDPQFRVSNRYNKTSVKYDGEVINLSQNVFDTKVNVDGVTFALGLAFHF